jgi:acyl carrier protein
VNDKLKRIISKILGVPEDIINNESSRKTIKAWDSMKHIRLMLSIEEEFEIKQLSMDEIVEMTSVAKIKEVLQGRGVNI